MHVWTRIQINAHFDLIQLLIDWFSLFFFCQHWLLWQHIKRSFIEVNRRRNLLVVHFEWMEIGIAQYTNNGSIFIIRSYSVEFDIGFQHMSLQYIITLFGCFVVPSNYYIYLNHLYGFSGVSWNWNKNFNCLITSKNLSFRENIYANKLQPLHQHINWRGKIDGDKLF